MAAPTVSAMPPAPVRATDDPETYIEKVDAWNPALNVLGQEVQAVGQYVGGIAEGLDSKLALALFAGTSITSVTIGTGLKSFVTQAGLSYVQGSFVKVRHDATHWLWGEVDAYDTVTGDIDVLVQVTEGAGTFASWNFSLAEPIGVRPEPADGPTTAAGVSEDDYVTPKGLADSLAPVAATVGGTQTPDCSNARTFQWLLSSNITLNPPSATKNGAPIFFEIKQPPSGGPYTLSRHASVLKGAEIDLTLSTGANKVDMLAGIILDGALKITGITRDVG